MSVVRLLCVCCASSPESLLDEPSVMTTASLQCLLTRTVPCKTTKWRDGDDNSTTTKKEKENPTFHTAALYISHNLSKMWRRNITVSTFIKLKIHSRFV